MCSVDMLVCAVHEAACKGQAGRLDERGPGADGAHEEEQPDAETFERTASSERKGLSEHMPPAPAKRSGGGVQKGAGLVARRRRGNSLAASCARARSAARAPSQPRHARCTTGVHANWARRARRTTTALTTERRPKC